jgi:hypothetical protein
LNNFLYINRFRINAKNEIQVGLLWPFEPIWIIIPQDKYCIHEINKLEISAIPENDNLQNYALYLCHSDIEDYQIYVNYPVWGILVIIIKIMSF